MSDRDNITLPRKHIDYAAHALEHFNKNAPDPLVIEIIHHLRAALAAEPTKQEPVESDDDEEFTRQDVTTLLLEVMDWTYAKAHRERPMTEAEQKVLDDIRTALAAEQPRHPGYIIGNHWFETAYERLCAGEAEDAILEDYEVVREPRLRDLRRDAERYRWLRERAWFQDEFEGRYGDSGETVQELDAAIDAAMEASTAPASAAADSSTAPEAKP